MDFKNKVKAKQKEKENSKNKSKEKYSNYNTNYLINKRDKNKSLSSLTNNEKCLRKDYFENVFKEKNNNNINIINNKKQKNKTINESYYDYSYFSSNLIEKDTDTYEEIKQKNKKLRELIIKLSEQLGMLSSKYEKIKIAANNEKKKLLDKLDKISTNYRLYAESYNEYIKLKKEKQIIEENSSQINIILNSCKNSLVNLLKKNMNYYSRLKLFYENKNNQYKYINFDEFIFSLKEEILNNLLQFKNQLDVINYPSFFYEYNTFIYEENNYYGLKNKDKAKGFIRNQKVEINKENNSFDEYRKFRRKEKEKDKSPKEEKKSIKRNILLREKTPSKSNCNLSYFKNMKNFQKTHFHNCFNEKISGKINKYNSNNNTNKSNISKEKDVIFSDVGNIIPFKKRYSSRK